MTLRITSRPQTVSQVVQRAFTKHGRLVRCSVWTGELDLVTTRQMGATTAIPLDRVPKFERKWQRVEKRIPVALDAIRQGRALSDSSVVETLRDCLAMHLARSLDVLAAGAALWRCAAEPSIRSMARRQSTALSLQLRWGIEPVGREARVLEARTLYHHHLHRMRRGAGRRSVGRDLQALPRMRRFGVAIVPLRGVISASRAARLAAVTAWVRV